MKNKKIKYILGGIALIVFATGLSILIIMGNNKKNEEQRQQLEIEKGIETNMVFSEELPEPTSGVRFPDKRNFTEEELAEDDEFPEGADHYEVDEPEPQYHVTINNFNELSDSYNDYKDCIELPYYLHTYFNLCTGNLDELYVVTLIDDSCVCDEYTSVVTVDATVDKYPDVTLHIEYNKMEQVFGISSSLGDYSLEELRKNAEKSEGLKYNPEIEMDDNTAPPAFVQEY